MSMIRPIASTLLAALLFAALPFSASALSCMSPDMMIEYYVDGGEYSIVTATPSESYELTTSEPDEFTQGTNGFDGQLLTVETVHKGSFADSDWVYFERDATWGYFCTGAPPVSGTKSLYIIRQSNNPWDLDMVADVYALDSDLASELLAALKSAESEGHLREWTPENHAEGIAFEIRHLVNIIRIKLAEWRFWNGS